MDMKIIKRFKSRRPKYWSEWSREWKRQWLVATVRNHVAAELLGLTTKLFCVIRSKKWEGA